MGYVYVCGGVYQCVQCVCMCAPLSVYASLCGSEWVCLSVRGVCYLCTCFTVRVSVY